MKAKLFFQAIWKFLLGLLIVSLLLFLPAGSLKFWNAHLLIAILFAPMFCAGIVLMIKDPALLRKRLQAREKEKEQKAVVLCSGLMFTAAFVIAGLNFRFQWIILPKWAVIVGACLFLLSYLLYAEVLRENAYLSRTIEVQKDQKVIDTGLYAVVRHPMYLATLVLFLSMGIVLGSPISIAILLFYVPIIVKRIRNEEMVLSRELAGYVAYQKKTEYRLIPFIW